MLKPTAVFPTKNARRSRAINERVWRAAGEQYSAKKSSKRAKGEL